MFECGSPSENTLGGSTNTISATVAAPDGSRPAKYDFTATVPADAEGQCTVSVKDQRNWGMCFDLNVAAAPCAAAPASDANGAIIGTWPQTEKDAQATLTCPEGTEGTVTVTCGPGGIFLAPNGQCLTADGEVPELNEDGTPVSSGGVFTPGTGGFTVMIIIVVVVAVVGLVGAGWFFFVAGAATGAAASNDWGNTKTTSYAPQSNNNFGGPQSAGPQSSYGGPQSGYGAPQSGYGAPQSGYGAPQSGYGQQSHRSAPGAPNSGYYSGAAVPPPSNRF